MLYMYWHKYLVITAISFAAGIMSWTIISSVFAQTTNSNAIHACVGTGIINKGNIRIISPDETCQNDENSLNWQQYPKPGTEFHFFLSASGANDTDYFKGKDFVKAHIESSQFENTDFSGTNFSRAFIANNTFTKVNFTNAKISNARQFSEKFYDSNLSGLNAKNAIIGAGTEFYNVNFTNANLTEADFSGTIFYDSDLTGASTTGTDFTNVTWSNTICPDGTNSDTNINTCEGHLTP